VHLETKSGLSRTGVDLSTETHRESGADQVLVFRQTFSGLWVRATFPRFKGRSTEYFGLFVSDDFSATPQLVKVKEVPP
jgi:hypothetical protein